MKKVPFRFLTVLFLLIAPASGNTAGNQNSFFMPQNAMKQTTATDAQIGMALQKQITRQQYLQKQRQTLQQQKLKRQTGNTVAKTTVTKTVAETVKENTNTGNQASSGKRTAYLNKKPEKVIKTPLLTQDKKATSDTITGTKTETSQTPAPKETQTASAPTQTEQETVKQTKLTKVENTQPQVKPQESENPEISLQNPYEAAMQDYQKDLELIRKGEELNNTRLEAMLKDFVDKEHIIRVQ